MNKKLLFACVAMLAGALTAADAITGKWVYLMQVGGGNPPREVTLELKADAANLTGSVLQPAGGNAAATAPPPAPAAISKGQVDGNKISFEVARQTQNGSSSTKYEGTITGINMYLKITAPGRGGGEVEPLIVYAKKSTP
jgi:hypothetical protein